MTFLLLYLLFSSYGLKIGIGGCLQLIENDVPSSLSVRSTMPSLRYQNLSPTQIPTTYSLWPSFLNDAMRNATYDAPRAQTIRYYQ